MSRILGDGSGERPVKHFGTAGWIIRKLMYRNTAAKFWSALLDELLEDFPGCDGVRLSALCGGALVPALLNPEAALEETLNNLGDADLKDAFRATLQDLELLGPPAAIAVVLFSGAEEIGTAELPLDCANAELLPFLLVWLLEWAGLSEFAWNRERVLGDIRADDPQRRLVYRIRFDLRNHHLSEGLFDRKALVRFQRLAAGPEGAVSPQVL